MLVGAPLTRFHDADWAGAVMMLSGKDGRKLGAWFGRDRRGMYGSGLAGGADVDRDGVDDFAVASVGFGPGTGYVELRSGKHGELRRSWIAEAEQWGYGRALAFVPDLDGDGLRELAVSAEVCAGDDWRKLKEAGRGSIAVYSTHDGRLLRTIESTSAPRRFGASFSLVPDLDGDGVDDLVAGSSASTPRGPCALAAYSWKSNERLFAVAYRSSEFGDLGPIAVADFDGDGRPDFAAVDDTSVVDASARVVMISGATQRELPCDVVLRPGNASRLAIVGDIDRDGVEDFVAACHGSWSDEPARLYSGKTRRELGRFVGSADWIDLHCIGASIVPLGDIDGDGVPDVLLGDVNLAAPGVRGCVEAWSGNTGTLLWRQTRLAALAGEVHTPRR